MSMRFRRSVKIAPGLRVNFNKNSWGLTLGPRGAHYTINSSGRRTTSVGLPGTGIWWQESSGGGKRRATRSVETPELPLYEKDFADKPKPAFFAKHFENDIYAALQSMNQKDFEEIVKKYPEAEIFAKFMLVTIMISKPETGRAGLAIAEEIWSRRDELMADAMYRKYAPGIKTTMQIVPGIYYVGPYTAHCLGYALAELYQVDNQLDKSEAILKQLSPDEITPIALLEISFLQKKYDEIIKSTDDPSADTNESAAREMYRAMSFRETGNPEAAILLLSEIVKNRSLDKALTLRSRYERALTYVKDKDSKKALADFQFIMSKDGDYLDVREEIKKLH